MTLLTLQRLPVPLSIALAIAALLATGCPSNERDSEGEPTEPGTEPVGEVSSMVAGDSVSAAGLAVGDLVVTEIMANPGVVSDTVGEWFEIYNASDHAVDLLDLEIAHMSGAGIRVSNTVVVPADGFAVLGNSISSELSTGGYPIDYVYSGFSLRNNSDEIVLRVMDVVIDTVTYSNPPEGASLSLTATSLDSASNDSEWNWCTSTNLTSGDKGTPGSANASCD